MALPIPGLPQLPPSAATPIIATIASEAISALLWQASQSPPAWGVFDDQGNQVVFPDSVLEFSHRQDSNISNFPVQEGQFASYNKVVLPYEVQLRFSKGGSQSDRTQFLQDIQNLWESIDLYTVVTPERTYPNMNLERYELTRRGPKGAYFLTEVDLYFLQIIPVTAQYTTTAVQLPNAQSAAAQPVSNVGSVQPQAPSSQQSQQGAAALSSLPDPALF
jgi:hypothetical protein